MPFAWPGLIDILRSFLDHGLMLDPWLAGIEEESFSFESQTVIRQAAESMAGTHWREPVISEALHDLPAMKGLGLKVAREVLASTAAAIAHEQKGHVRVDVPLTRDAVARVEEFVRERGFGALVWTYIAVTFAENHGAVSHYGSMTEEDFVGGRLHRPWARGPLDDELVLGLAVRAYRLDVHDGRRWVSETSQGRRLYDSVRQAMGYSGYLDERLRLIHVSQFNLLENWDQLVSRLFPDIVDQRRLFTDFCQLTPGMRILEVGCGMATQTFDGGLWEAVGPHGHLTGLDPAAGMLERAGRKAIALAARNVDFVRGRAESICFADQSFDAAVGVAFLHFTDAPRALAEMVRVTRRGGVVAVMAPCRFSFDAPWFRDWFAPIFSIAARYGVKVRSMLHRPGEVPDLFRSLGLRGVEVSELSSRWVFLEPDAAVYHLIQGVSFFQEVLELLPWRGRHDLIEELKERGQATCARTTVQERTVQTPAEFVRAVVP